MMEASAGKGVLTTIAMMTSPLATDTGVEFLSTPKNLQKNVATTKITTEVILLITIIATNLAMGCTLTSSDFKRQWKYPGGIILGIISQFVTYPLVAFGLIYLFNISSNSAVGVMLVVACPGSSISNLFTYFVDGDVCMSVCSTTLSILLSFGMLPALMYIYTHSWTSQALVIPYSIIAVALLIIICITLLGMSLRAWFPKFANSIVTIGSAIGLVGYSICALFYIILQTSIFYNTWNIYLLAFVLPIIAFIIGYFTGYIFKEHPSRCRTLAIEIVFQNVGIAVLTLAVTGVTLDWSSCVIFPILYSAASGLYGLIYLLMYAGLRDHSKTPDGYASLEPEDDFDNPWLLVETDMSFRY